jgi:hypothetical protein
MARPAAVNTPNEETTMSETSNESDGRLSFADAAAHVREKKQAAFAAMPVFGDDAETAEGARIFILDTDAAGQLRLRFVAGPFFSSAFAAHETIPTDEIPDSVRALRFMPTCCEDDWLSGQIQVLIQKLVKAAGVDSAHMPDYENTPTHGAGPEAVFPISFIGRGGAAPH